jgi:hypothetical protein
MEEIIPQYLVFKEKEGKYQSLLPQNPALVAFSYNPSTPKPVIRHVTSNHRKHLLSTPSLLPSYIFFGAFLTISLAAASRYPSSVNFSTKSTIQSWQFLTYTRIISLTYILPNTLKLPILTYILPKRPTTPPWNLHSQRNPLNPIPRNRIHHLLPSLIIPHNLLTHHPKF